MISPNPEFTSNQQQLAYMHGVLATFVEYYRL